MRNINCINCFQRGHTFKECRYHIRSYGILAYKVDKKELSFLLIRRKNTIGYINFIRGRYQYLEDLEILVGEMTLEEKNKILDLSFEELWSDLWINHESRTFKNDFSLAKRRFENLDIDNIFNSTIYETMYLEEEYSIPKGRRNHMESELDCAIREFMEETGYKSNEFELLHGVPPIEERFYGSNGVPYKHIYYIAKIKTNRIPIINPKDILQAGEVKSINWFTYSETMNIFRVYEATKKNIILTIANFLRYYT